MNVGGAPLFSKFWPPPLVLRSGTGQNFKYAKNVGESPPSKWYMTWEGTHNRKGVKFVLKRVYPKCPIFWHMKRKFCWIWDSELTVWFCQYICDSIFTYPQDHVDSWKAESYQFLNRKILTNWNRSTSIFNKIRWFMKPRF